MPLRSVTRSRAGRSLLLGTTCLAVNLGAASVDVPYVGAASAQGASAQAAPSCPTNQLSTSVFGTNGTPTPQQQQVVQQANAIVGQALQNTQPFKGHCPAVSAIVGVSWKGQRTYIGYGLNAPAYAPGTIVEIGSITKVFTTALFAEAAQEGKLKYGDAFSTYGQAIGLPAPLTPCGGQVTLQQLASFSAGMADEPGDLPSDLAPKPNAGALMNGVANYPISKFKAWVAHANPSTPTVTTTLQTTTCPTTYDDVYSNASIGVVGYVVAAQFGQPWAQLIGQRILQPLGMTSTFVPYADGTPPAWAQPRVASGRYVNFTLAPPWPFFAWFAAGTLRSDASDVLSFGEAGLGHSTINGSAPPPQQQRAVDALESAIKAGLNTTYPVYNKTTGDLEFYQGFAWVRNLAQPAKGNVPVLWKNGGTDGFKSMLVLNRAQDLVVFISAGQAGVDATSLGLQLAQQIK